MRFGLDMDGVIAQWSRAAREMLNERFDVGFDLTEEVPSWEFIEETVGPKMWAWLWTAGVERGLFMRPEVMPGSTWALAKLCEKHDVILLTDRPKLARAHTLKWICQNFPFDFAGVLINKTKTEIQCDVFLDDKPQNVVKIKKAFPDSEVFLRTARYNRSFEWSPRAESWEQFIALSMVYRSVRGLV